MKVTFAKNYKEYMTVNEVEIAKEIIRDEKKDENTAKDWAEYMIREALTNTDDYLVEVLKASAEIAGNCNTWNAYSDHSEKIDIWVSATAETREGFIKASAYLSDIWKTGAEHYPVYKQYYKEAEA